MGETKSRVSKMLDSIECCGSCKSKAWVVIDHAAMKTSCSECDLDFGYYSIEDCIDFVEIDTVRLSDWTNSLRSSNGLSINTTELNNASSSDDFLSSGN